MSMIEWAENEVKIACKRENPNWNGKDFDYGCNCYQSALKAYKSLCEDGHSGCSFSVTRNILIKLLNEQPLTQIEDTDDIWSNEFCFLNSTVKSYQCSRRYSLFKYIDEYGKITYHDNDRVIFYELGDSHSSHFDIADKVINELYPIKMPYLPKEKPYKVYGELTLSDKKNGDYDMAALFYCITPEGEKVDIKRYYDLRGEKPVEIVADEYFWIKNKSKLKGFNL